jgi:hypothetical protein
MSPMRNEIIAIAMMLAFSGLAHSPEAVHDIKDFDFNAYLSREYADCLNYLIFNALYACLVVATVMGRQENSE